MSLKKCIICLDETGVIVSRCSCGDASIVCERCFYDYWDNECCPYHLEEIPEFKCPICKNIDKRQQLTHIFNEIEICNSYFHFLKGKMKVIKFLKKKLNDKSNENCDCCLEIKNYCNCLCSKCFGDYNNCGCYN